jgi:hypothetical protein
MGTEIASVGALAVLLFLTRLIVRDTKPLHRCHSAFYLLS